MLHLVSKIVNENLAFKINENLGKQSQNNLVLVLNILAW